MSFLDDWKLPKSIVTVNEVSTSSCFHFEYDDYVTSLQKRKQQKRVHTKVTIIVKHCEVWSIEMGKPLSFVKTK